MGNDGPTFLRWWPASVGVEPGHRAAGPKEERFETLDAALDAVEARWEALQHQAPQILDKRRVLLVSTEELRSMMAAEEP